MECDQVDILKSSVVWALGNLPLANIFGLMWSHLQCIPDIILLYFARLSRLGILFNIFNVSLFFKIFHFLKLEENWLNSMFPFKLKYFRIYEYCHYYYNYYVRR